MKEGHFRATIVILFTVLIVVLFFRLPQFATMDPLPRVVIEPANANPEVLLKQIGWSVPSDADLQLHGEVVYLYDHGKLSPFVCFSFTYIQDGERIPGQVCFERPILF